MYCRKAMTSLEFSYRGEEEKRFISPYSKIVDEETAIQRIAYWESQPLDVVVLEAVMDLPHYRHAEYLLAAANLGDKLVVRLNSDDLIKSRKDSRGPIVDFEKRSKHLAHYPYVDLVTGKNDIGPGWLERYRPTTVVKSVTSGIKIAEEAVSMFPIFEKLGIRLVLMDQFANTISLDNYLEETAKYSYDIFGSDKFSDSIIRDKIAQRAIDDLEYKKQGTH